MWSACIIQCKVSRVVVQVSLSFFLFRLVLTDLIFRRTCEGRHSWHSSIGEVLAMAAHFFSHVEYVRDELSPKDTTAIPYRRRSSPDPKKKAR